MKAIKKLTLLLLVSISFASCDPEDLPDVNVCIPDDTMGTYCGLYSMKNLEFKEKLQEKPASETNGAFCIAPKSWLKDLRPAIKENYRVIKDSKKKKLEIGYESRVRRFFEIN